MPTSLENNKHIYQAIKEGDLDTAWIGVHKVGQNFHTVHGGAITFGNWHRGEPSGDGSRVELTYKASLEEK